MKKIIWKIRLRPDGEWENVYYGEEPTTVIDPKKIAMLEEVKRLEEFKEYLIEAALEIKGFAEANEVIQRVKNKT
jgi:hypothetical protein